MQQMPGARGPITEANGGNPPTIPGAPPTPAAPPPPAGGSPSPFDVSSQPTGAETLGQPMYPWLMPYTGAHSAPITGYEQQGLNSISGLAGNNFGLNPSQNYINDLASGKYLDVSKNPYLNNIEGAADTQRQTQDSRALQELQSRAAAGGNGLSGALMQQEGDYSRNSNANFNQLMNQMYQNAYQQERGYQNGAPGQQENLLQSQLGGIGAEMGFGAVPRDVANQELTGQYADFIRQTGALQDQSRYPDYLNLAQQGRGYPSQTQNQFGNSSADQLSSYLSQLFGGGSGGTDIMSILNGLFGGSGSSGDAPADQPAADGIRFDGASDYNAWLGGIGHAPGQPDYGAAITQRETDAKAKQAQLGKASGASKAMTVLAMIMNMMGGKKQTGQGGSRGAGGGGGNPQGGGSLADTLKNLFNKPTAPSAGTPPPTDQSPGGGVPQSAWDSFNAGNLNPGEQGFDPLLTSDINDNPNFYATDNNLPSIPFSGNSFSDVENGDFSSSDNSGNGWGDEGGWGGDGGSDSWGM